MRRRDLLAGLAALAASAFVAGRASAEPPDFAALREKMVKEQIEARGVTNPRVLEAMRAVPRHEFVPKALQ